MKPEFDITVLLAGSENGDPTAAERLWPLVYDELRSLAGRYLENHGSGLTLQPTALVHEAYVRLVGKDDAVYNGRAHFLAVAAKVMRGILVDRAREHASLKRGGNLLRVTLHEGVAANEDSGVDILDLNGVLERLGTLDARKARVVELRFFAGMSLEQTAEVLGVARSTVAEDWRIARAWVAKELGGAAP